MKFIVAVDCEGVAGVVGAPVIRTPIQGVIIYKSQAKQTKAPCGTIPT